MHCNLALMPTTLPNIAPVAKAQRNVHVFLLDEGLNKTLVETAAHPLVQYPQLLEAQQLARLLFFFLLQVVLAQHRIAIPDTYPINGFLKPRCYRLAPGVPSVEAN